MQPRSTPWTPCDKNEVTMQRLIRMWRRLTFFFKRDKVDQDLAEEMRLH